MSLFATLLLSYLVHPLAILAGVVPYFGIRNAPWRSFGAAAAAGAFTGIILNVRGIYDLTLLALSLIACVAASCLWWLVLHWGYELTKRGSRAKTPPVRSRPRLVKDDDDDQRESSG